MTALRLEKFANPVQLNTHARLVSLLEIEDIRKQAFEDGIKQGAKAASDAFEAQQSMCLNTIQESIGDAFFAREEAHRLTMTSLKPLIESLVDTLAPSLHQTGLIGEISDIVETALSASKDEITIFVSAEQTADIKAMFAKTDDRINIITDKTLMENEAKVEWSGGFDQVDMNAGLVAIQKAIEEFFAELNSTQNGDMKNVG